MDTSTESGSESCTTRADPTLPVEPTNQGGLDESSPALVNQSALGLMDQNSSGGSNQIGSSFVQHNHTSNAPETHVFAANYTTPGKLYYC